jgi:hypothetical protein
MCLCSKNGLNAPEIAVTKKAAQGGLFKMLRAKLTFDEL